MKTQIYRTIQRSFILLTLGLACVAVSLPKAFGVLPAPDGGYAGGNTAEGQNALFSLTTGTYNTAVGLFSLRSNTDGDFNMAMGAGALLVNTADQNTATGAGALLSNTIGIQNTANGAFALFSNTTAFSNTATGASALLNNITGEGNTADGASALLNNITGYINTAIGDQALHSNTTGSNNTALGFGAGGNVTTANNVICIGVGVNGGNVSNSCYIGSIFNATSSGGTAVFINSDGKLGTVTSSRRFKEEIRPMQRASEALFALKPVTFRYTKGIDPQGIPQFGLVAEEVEAVNPDLVVRDKEGKVNTVRYDAINAMLLNEFLKEHRKVQEQEATIAELQFGMKAVATTLDEQATQLQKVRAQIELTRPQPRQVVLKTP